MALQQCRRRHLFGSLYLTLNVGRSVVFVVPLGHLMASRTCTLGAMWQAIDIGARLGLVSLHWHVVASLLLLDRATSALAMMVQWLVVNYVVWLHLE